MSQPTPFQPTDTERHFLFAVLARRAALIDDRQLAQACDAWATHAHPPLAEWMAQRGWLNADQEREVWRRVDGHEREGSRNPGKDPEATRAPSSEHCVAADSQAATLAPAAAEPGGPPTAPAGPSRQDQRYVLARLHATGGTGQIWLARDGDLGREVALKVLRPDRAGQAAVQKRFVEEARIAGQLEHPAIVPVYELARRADDGQPFYAMRFVKGRTLTQAARDYHEKRARGEAGQLDQLALVGAFVAVCNAVAYAHARGVIHRDLKGQNVVLGDFGEVIVLDWGLAKVVDRPGEDGAAPVVVAPGGRRDETLTGQVLGTPAYMAPEQAAGRPDLINERTDVYGLGAVLYEILTGRPPFGGEEFLVILHRVREEEPARPRQVAPDVSPALEAVCLKAMAKEAAARYPGAADVARDVQRWLADEPMTAYREPRAARLARWLRRHRAGATAAAVAVAVACLCLGAATLLLTAAYREAEQQRDLARGERDKANARFRLARRAVDDYHTRVGDSPELKAHGLELLRQQLLRSAAEFYRQLTREEAEDPAVRAEQGRAYLRLAALSQQLDHKEEAEVACQQARAIFEELTARQPGEPAHTRDLAASIFELGTLYRRTGRGGLGEQAYQEALAVRGRLAGQHPDERDYQRDLGASHNGLGAHLFECGQYDRARQAYEQAIAVRRWLAAADPAEAEDLQQLAASLRNLGILYSDTGRHDRAEQAYREAMQLQRRLATAYPDVPRYQEGLAQCSNSLGVLYVDTDQPRLGERAYREALAAYERLAAAHPQVPAYQFNVADMHNNLGLLYAATCAWDLAAAEYRHALELYQPLVRANPEVIDYAVDQGGTEGNLADLESERGRLHDALEDYDRCISRLDTITRRESQKATAWNGLRNALGGRAVVLARMGRHAEAARDLQRALEPGHGAIRPEVRVWQVLARVYAADHAGATAAAAEVAREPDLTSRGFYDLACGCALAVAAAKHDAALTDAKRARLTQRYGRAAVDLLGRARAAGFFKIAANVERLGQDPLMDPLRQMDEFKQLRDELEKKRVSAEKSGAGGPQK
jgi:serine/threonine-protein kinase